MKKITQLPKGVKIFLPEDAKKKRYLENRIRNIFELWGYQEVITPTFEFFETLSIGAGESLKDKMYKFLDQSGQILALRADMTTPVARLVASNYKSFKIPIRLCYISNIFRYGELQAGKDREFYQAGVELFGWSKPEADAEVISLLISLLNTLGIKEFKVDLGQISIYRSIIKKADIEENEERSLRNAIHKKNLGEVKDILADLRLNDREKEAVMVLANSYTQGEEIFNNRDLIINREGEKALENLKLVYELLRCYGYGDKITIDLGVLRGIDYYTGLIFETFVPNLGYSICGGGRYDNLTAQFGIKLPATGFALGVERVLLALKSEFTSKKLERRDKYLIICCKEDTLFLKVAYDLAKNLRERNVCVQVQLEEKIEEEILRRKGINKIIYIGEHEDEVRVVDLINNKEEILKIIDILAED
jgi:ATP phosphoribosyltransferase regulatory subunit